MIRVYSTTAERDPGGDRPVVEYEATYTITPGTPESGRFGPPERYDPGSPPEVELVDVTRDGVACEPDDDEVEHLTRHILDTHQWDTGPDPDDERDRRFDDERDR